MESSLNKEYQLLLVATGIIVLSLIVLITRYAYSYELIQEIPKFLLIPSNTALCFLFSGLGLACILRHQTKLASILSLSIFLFSALTLIHYVVGIDLALDRIFMDENIADRSKYPGHMHVVSALCFLLVATCLGLMSLITQSKLIHAAMEICAWSILIISTIAMLLGLLEELAGIYYQGKSYSHIPLVAAIGFLILAFSFLMMLWSRAVKPKIIGPYLSATVLFVGVLSLDLLSPLGLAIGVAYLPLIFYSLKFSYEKTAIVFAALATLFTVIVYMLSSPGLIDDQFIIINRLLSILAIWITAFLICQHKITEKKLLKSEEALKLGWRGAGEGMWDWDIDSNRMIFSERYLALLGYLPGEMDFHYDAWSSRLHADDKAQTLALLAAHIKNKTPYETEYRLLHKSGQWRWYLTKGQALWDEGGRAIRMAGSLSDITERKSNDIELRLLKLAVDNSKDVILITNANPENPVIVFASKAILTISGYSEEEVLGRNPKFLQGKDTDRKQLDALKIALVKKQPFSTQLLNYAKDGREFWIHINIFPVNNAQGETTHFAAVQRDITSNKKMEMEREKLIEALEKSNQELDDFAYVASHDLKAPLRVIDNTSKWLEEDLQDKLDEESQENLSFLRNRVLRMEKLLDDLLAYSKIGRKLDDSYDQLVTGDVLINDICELINCSDSFKIIASPAFKQLHINRMPLHQILLNLISNAIKHHDKLKGEIHITVETLKDYYVIDVTDDGPGIPQKYEQQVFKMFQTLKPRDQVEGSGMGLAVVRKYIEHFGGKISLQPNEGRGATFRFTWPVSQK